MTTTSNLSQALALIAAAAKNIGGPTSNGMPEVVFLRDYYDTAAPPTDFTDAFQAAYAASNGGMVWVNNRPEGGYPVNVRLYDPNIRIGGFGTLLQSKGQAAIKIVHTIDTAGFTTTHTEETYSSFGSNSSWEKHSRFTVPTAELANIQVGDVLFYDSKEYFRAKNLTTWDDTEAADLLSVNLGLKTFDAGQVEVMGFEVRFSGGADIANTNNTTAMAAKDTLNNKVVTASTGGGTGIIASVTKTRTGEKALILKTISGNFPVGATLTVAGGVAGAAGTVTSVPQLVAHDALPFNPVDDLRLHRRSFRNLVTDIRVTIDTVGNPDDITTNKNDRTPAIDLLGVVGGKVHPHIIRTWGSGVRLRSTYRVYVKRPRIDWAPNDTYNEAFGYGILETGGCHYNHIDKIVASNVRHAYTTGVSARAVHPRDDAALQGPANDLALQEALLSLGLPKWSRIDGVDCTNPMAAGADTHGGGWELSFGKIVVRWSGNAGRRESDSCAFQDRAWGTEANEGIESWGGTDGVRLSAHRYPAPAPWINRYKNITVNGHARYGVIFTNAVATTSDGTLRVDSASSINQTIARTWGGWYEIDEVKTRADIDIHTMSANFGRDLQPQAGICFQGAVGVKAKIFSVRASAFNYCPILVQSGSPDTIHIDNLTMDFTECPAGVGPTRLDSSVRVFTYTSVKAIKHAVDALNGMIRVNVANQAINYGDVYCVNATGIPFLHPSGSGNATAILTALTADVAVPAPVTVAQTVMYTKVVNSTVTRPTSRTDVLVICLGPATFTPNKVTSPAVNGLYQDDIYMKDPA